MRKVYLPNNITVPFPSTKRFSIERPNSVIDLYQYIQDVTVENNFIEVTKLEFLALVNAKELKFPAIYKITDIENGLFLNSLSKDEFDSSGPMLFLAPDYSLHEQYHANDGAIANGAIVTWGGYYWKNISGGSVTPDLPDEVNIDSNPALFTKLSKSVTNGYEEIVCTAVVNPSNLNILLFTDNYNNTLNNYVAGFFGISYENTMVNKPSIQFNEGWCITNCKVTGTGYILGNKSVSTPAIRRCEIPSGKSITNMEGVGTMDVSYVENCDGLTGNHCHLSYCKNIDITGGSTVDENELNNLSYIENITINGDSNFIASGYLDSSSFDKNITITGDGNEFNTREYLGDSGIDGFTITANNFSFKNVRLENTSVLSNFTTSTNGRQIVDFHVSSKSIDLTGFDRDIVGERIVGGKGWFVIEHNFSTSPLNSGSSVFYNLIPTGARITSINVIGNTLSGGVGALLNFGLETDSPTYITPTAIATLNSSGASATGFSAAATANRSLEIKATVANVTGGKVKVIIEFII